MGENDLTAPQEDASEQPSTNKRWQFSMRSVLLAPLIFVISVGSAQGFGLVATDVCIMLFDGRWTWGVREWLIDIEPSGWPVEWLFFAWLQVPKLCLVAFVTLILGLWRSRNARFLAWSLALGFPIRSAVVVSWDMHDEYWYTILQMESVSACGFIVGIGAWYIGWRISGRFYEPVSDDRATWLSRAVEMATWMLAVALSAYGWSHLASWR